MTWRMIGRRRLTALCRRRHSHIGHRTALV